MSFIRRNNQVNTNADDALKALEKNPGLVARGCLTALIFVMLFFSGLGAVSLYIFSHIESSFLEKAVKAQALVTNITEKEKREYHGNTNSTRNHSNTGYKITYITIIDLRFQNKNGETIETRLSDGENSLIRLGDTVDILYDPEDPKEAKLFKNRSNPSKLRDLSNIFGIAFAVLFALAVFLSRGKKPTSLPER